MSLSRFFQRPFFRKKKQSQEDKFPPPPLDPKVPPEEINLGLRWILANQPAAIEKIRAFLTSHPDEIWLLSTPKKKDAIILTSSTGDLILNILWMQKNPRQTGRKLSEWLDANQKIKGFREQRFALTAQKYLEKQPEQKSPENSSDSIGYLGKTNDLCCFFEVAAETIGDSGCALAESLDAISDAPCYVATASLEMSERGAEDEHRRRNHPDLIALRRFRDQILSRTSAGRLFIRAYYHYGRYPAALLRRSGILRKISRALIVRPLARMARRITR